MSIATRARSLCLPLAAALLFSVLPAAAQDQAEDERPQLEERLFTIRHGSVDDIMRVVRGLVSAAGRVTADPGSSTIVVLDTPGDLERIAAVVVEMDRQPDDLLISFHVFVASREEGESDVGGLPDSVRRGIAELSRVMAYSRFRLVGSEVVNVASNADSVSISITGELDIGLGFDLDYDPRSRFLSMRNLAMSVRRGERWSRLLLTDAVVEDGGVAVVGASRLEGGEVALLTIVSMEATGPTER